MEQPNQSPEQPVAEAEPLPEAEVPLWKQTRNAKLNALEDEVANQMSNIMSKKSTKGPSAKVPHASSTN